jgi:hypothetical protein
MSGKRHIVLVLVSSSLFGCVASPVSSTAGSSSSASFPSYFEDLGGGERFFALGEPYADGSGDSATAESVSLSEGKMTVVADVECG